MRECKEVLKGGLLMKQYYQFMLRGVVTDAQGLQTNANIDDFEEDLHKMLVVRLTVFFSSTWSCHLNSHNYPECITIVEKGLCNYALLKSNKCNIRPCFCRSTLTTCTVGSKCCSSCLRPLIA